MAVMNDIDRFHLVADVVDRVPSLGYRAAYLKQFVRDRLVDHAQYIRQHGQDMPEIRKWLVELLEEEITEVDLSKTKDNYKAALQELVQAESSGLPNYRTVKESGPSHNKTFYVEVVVNGEVLGYGSGKSKKEAQQSAAKVALEALNALDEDEYGSDDVEDGQHDADEYEAY